VTTPVTLVAIAEDSGARVITQAELLANASDVDNASLTATNLAISSGSGTLVNNGNGTWTYTPALNDFTAVSFSYTITDGSLSAAGSATLDLTPVNDAPVTTPVTLTAIAEDSGAASSPRPSCWPMPATSTTPVSPPLAWPSRRATAPWSTTAMAAGPTPLRSTMTAA